MSYLSTHSTIQGFIRCKRQIIPSWNSLSRPQFLSRTINASRLWNLRVHYGVHINISPNPFFRHLHSFTPLLNKTHLNFTQISTRAHAFQSPSSFQVLWSKQDYALTSISRVCAVGRDSSVGIATRYGLDGPESNPGGSEIFRTRPDRPWGSPILLYDGYRMYSRGKVAGAWLWPTTPSIGEAKERVDLYIYSHAVSSSPVLGLTSLLPLPLPARATRDVHSDLIILFRYVNSSNSHSVNL